MGLDEAEAVHQLMSWCGMVCPICIDQNCLDLDLALFHIIYYPETPTTHTSNHTGLLDV
jgi:hypothetical protein